MSVTVELVDHVLRIGVDRAAKRNAWNLEVIEGVAAAYERMDDPDVRAAVVYGHGEHFSAGLDLAEVGPHVAEHGRARRDETDGRRDLRRGRAERDAGARRHHCARERGTRARDGRA